jgi:hypothetical protein
VLEIFINTDHPGEAESEIKAMGLDYFKKGALGDLLPGAITSYIADQKQCKIKSPSRVQSEVLKPNKGLVESSWKSTSTKGKSEPLEMEFSPLSLEKSPHSKKKSSTEE